MNRKELIEKMSEKSGLTALQSKKALNGIINSTFEELKTGKVCLVGFGTFMVAERPGRQGRNPKTGELLEIKSRRVPIFRAGSSLKDQINQKNESEGGEVEHSVYYANSAELIVRQYCQRIRIKRILGMFLACTDVILFRHFMEMVGYLLGGIIVLPIYLLSIFVLLMGIRFFECRSFTSLSQILYDDCDPVKY